VNRFLRGNAKVLQIRGNSALLQKYAEFSASLKAIKSDNPLTSPNGYYPYGTLDIIPRILTILDRCNIDLEQHVRDKTILDLGAGDGDLSFFFELFNPKRIVAVDWGPTNNDDMEGCQVLKRALRSDVELMNMDIHSFDFKQFPVFDTVVCFGFLYHSPHPLFVLNNLSEKSRNLFLTTKIFDSDKSYVYFYDVGECNRDATNWWCFTTKALELMLKRTGFELVLMERLDSNIGKSDPVDTRLDGRVFAYARSIVRSETHLVS
jgi:2-polyprenyl-3-methyl-5-hydroxy-6-metoxy-1,4-benzoquinol methylase